MRQAAPQRLTQRVQPKRLTAHIGMQSEREYERLLRALLDHGFELMHDHVGIFARTVSAVQDRV